MLLDGLRMDKTIGSGDTDEDEPTSTPTRTTKPAQVDMAHFGSPIPGNFQTRRVG